MRAENERESPTVEWMQRMRAAFMAGISEDDMRELAKELMARAKKGDREALRLVLAYTVPLPAQPTQHQRISYQVPPQRALPGGRRNGRVIDVEARPAEEGGGVTCHEEA